MYRIVLPLVALLLSGCAVKPTKPEINYTAVTILAARADFCTQYGVIDQAAYNEFRGYWDARVNSYSYDLEKLQKEYAKHFHDAAYENGRTGICASAKKYVEDVVAARRYNRQSYQQQAVAQTNNAQELLNLFGEAASSFQQNTAAMVPQSTHSAPPINGLLQQEQSRHYQVMTPKGLQRCTVTPSGVTFCN